MQPPQETPLHGALPCPPASLVPMEGPATESPESCTGHKLWALQEHPRARWPATSPLPHRRAGVKLPFPVPLLSLCTRCVGKLLNTKWKASNRWTSVGKRL